VSAHRLAPLLLVFAGVVVLAFSEGGYFPVSWGWSALGYLLVVFAVLFVGGRVSLSRAEAAFVGALGLLLAWIVVSAVWSESVPRTVLESERALVYVAAAAALLSVASIGGHLPLLGGLFAALIVVCAYALGTRLFPDLLGFRVTFDNRLAEPIGYWNGLGLLAAMGIVLAVGIAAHARERVVRTLAASGTVLFVSTLYFTTSRGASVALAIAMLFALIVDAQRLRLAATGIVLLPLLGLAVLLASRSEGLAGIAPTLEAARSEGYRLAAALAVLAMAAAFVPIGLEAARARIAIGPGGRMVASRSLVAVLLAVSVVTVVVAGGPRLVGRAYDSFRGPASAGGELDDRLLTFSGSGRSEYWTVAWDAYRAHPWGGTGAGTFELQWYRDRPNPFGARDAHNLYLETVSELGPVGLLVLVVALAIPLIALRSSRRESLVVSAGAAYVAFLLHAGLDWDWELPAVTLAAMFSAAVVLVGARTGESSIEIGGRGRLAAMLVVAALGAAAFVLQVGNGRLARASSALADGRSAAAIEDARSARRWLPWDSEPWRLEAEAKLARRDAEGARKSLRSAIEKDPRDWRLWYGLTLATTGKERSAAADRARALNPLDPLIRYLDPDSPKEG
jgi:hypothetical protein